MSEPTNATTPDGSAPDSDLWEDDADDSADTTPPTNRSQPTGSAPPAEQPAAAPDPKWLTESDADTSATFKAEPTPVAQPTITAPAVRIRQEIVGPPKNRRPTKDTAPPAKTIAPADPVAAVMASLGATSTGPAARASTTGTPQPNAGTIMPAAISADGEALLRELRSEREATAQLLRECQTEARGNVEASTRMIAANAAMGREMVDILTQSLEAWSVGVSEGQKIIMAQRAEAEKEAAARRDRSREEEEAADRRRQAWLAEEAKRARETAKQQEAAQLSQEELKQTAETSTSAINSSLNLANTTFGDFYRKMLGWSFFGQPLAIATTMFVAFLLFQKLFMPYAMMGEEDFKDLQAGRDTRAAYAKASPENRAHIERLLGLKPSVPAPAAK